MLQSLIVMPSAWPSVSGGPIASYGENVLRSKKLLKSQNYFKENQVDFVKFLAEILVDRRIVLRGSKNWAQPPVDT